MTIDRVVTPRLRGEALGTRHLDAVAPIFADPRVGATMGGVYSREVVAGWLAHSEAEWETCGFGYWMFFEAATGAPVGRGGPRRADFDGEPVVELGWTTVPERWGEGFATEIGRVSLEVAFGPLGLDNVVAYTLPHNGASRRVMEKLGFAYEKTAPHRTFGDHVLYRRMCNTADRRA